MMTTRPIIQIPSTKTVVWSGHQLSKRQVEVEFTAKTQRAEETGDVIFKHTESAMKKVQTFMFLITEQSTVSTLFLLHFTG